MPQFHIGVTEYLSAYRAPGLGTPKPACIINDRQLTIGMVRSILTRNPGRAARRFMAAIVRPTLLFILDWNCPPDLSLNPTFQNKVRDFSATARVGELAQGVCYSYWHWQTGYTHVSDFESFANSRGLSLPVGSKTPDYVMLNPETGTVALMEAKGTQGSKYSSQMAAALRQIRTTIPSTPANRGFACVLALNTSNGAATLHLRDPEKPRRITDSIKHDIFRSSYAAWFDLIGMEEIAHWCRTPLERAERLNAQFFVRATDKNARAEDPLQKVVAEALGFNPNRVVFNLKPEVIEALVSIATFKTLRPAKTKISSAESCLELGSEILFPDGTAVTPE